MKSKKLLVLLVFLLMPLAGYSQSHHFDDVRNTLTEALKNQDAEKATSVYTKDGVQLPPDQDELVGVEAIQKGYESFFQSVTSASLMLTPTAAWVDGDFGVERGVYTMEVKTKSGLLAKIKARYIMVLKRLNETWRIKYSMLNNKEMTTSKLQDK